MKKFFAAAGIAAALLAVSPLAANATPVDYGRPQGAVSVQQTTVIHKSGPVQNTTVVRKDTHVYAAPAPKPVRRDFTYWRPNLEKAKYNHFTHAVYRDGFYRVNARDVHGHIVVLKINAYTGVAVVVSR